MSGGKITRREIFQIWNEVAGFWRTKVAHVQNRLSEMFLTENDSKEVKDQQKKIIYVICNKISTKLAKCNRKKDRFLTKHHDWLNQEVSLPSPCIVEETSSTSQYSRLSEDYQFDCEMLKRKKVSELSHAKKMKLRSSGNQQDVKSFNVITETTSAQASVHNPMGPLPFSDDQALSLLVNSKLIKHQYQTIRSDANERGASIFPSYNKVKAATDKCFPIKESLRVNERIAEVRLQHLLDHTASRIIQSQKEILNGVEQYLQNIVLVLKWGFGGSSSYSQYIQEFPDGESISDTDMFITSLVPLQMFVETTSKENKIIWQNPRPSSLRYCRPIRIQLEKETAELTQHEFEYMDNQIKNLLPFDEIVSECNIKITYQLIFTTVDDKVCNDLNTSSTQSCYLCGVTFENMNNIDSVVERDININELSFGLSTRHIWIRFFEYFLHLSYSLDVKKSGQEESIKVKERKLKILENFSEKLELIVDQVRPGETGTFNDEYAARRFFRKHSLSAEITGIKESLIYRCFVILHAMSSGYTVNKEQFHIYAKDTAKFFLQKYPWFRMPVTVHKVLLHGAQVISKALLPIGKLSEKAQLMRHEDLSLYRIKSSEKVSRTIRNNENLMLALLCSSDPLITSLMPLAPISKKAFLKLSRDVSNLLYCPKLEQHEEALAIDSTDESSDLEDSEETDQSDDYDYRE